MLPNLLIVGAMRSGTTSAYRYLSQHPQVFMAPHKEPHFFAFEERRPSYAGPGDDRLNRSVITNLAEYESLFEGAEDHQWRGEASAMYLYLPESLVAMQRHALEASVVVLLRNPVDRAYSSFHYQRFRHREPIESFEQALEAETGRIAANWAPIWHYRRAGLYADQLAAYLEVFGRDRVHLILHEDLERDQRAAFGRLFSDLRVGADAQIDYAVHHNRSGTPRSALLRELLAPGPIKRRMKRVLPARLQRTFERFRERSITTAAPMKPETRAALIQFFTDDIGRLESLIGRDLSSWRTGTPTGT
jgi:hypothetical protein